MEIVIILVLILFNGVLSMSEIALVSARKSRLEIDAKKGNKSAQTALKLSNEPDRFLSTVQIGITLIGILTGLYSGEAFAGDLAKVLQKISFIGSSAYPISKGIIVIIVTYLTLIFGELVPKRLGMSMSERISKMMARPMNILSIIASPLVWLLSKSTSLIVRLFRIEGKGDDKITEEEIKAMVKEGYNVGEVQEVEQDIVERVFNLGDRNVGSIMTHRNELTFLNVDDSKESIRSKVQENLFNIYPVVSDGNYDNILGVVHLKDLFGKIDNPDFSMKDVLRPAQFLPENKSVYKALEQFKNSREKYGIVIDEFAMVQGVVTLKDIVEALVGEMPEHGEEQGFVERADGTWLVDGQYSFYNFLEYFNMEDIYSEYDYNTLSGLILNILESVPRVGDSISWLNFSFEIVDMDGARIDKVLVKKNNPQ